MAKKTNSLWEFSVTSQSAQFKNCGLPDWKQKGEN